MKNDISVIILTYNEEMHIKRCINSLKNIVKNIFIIDSYSSDNTIKIAKELGAIVFQNPWKNYATQFNWALENCPIDTKWVWRVDADEFIDHELADNVNNQITTIKENISGIYVKRKIVFMGKPLMHGSWYPRWYLKIFRYGIGECENRWMDEHIVLSSGNTIKLEGNQIDDNLNNLTWWTDKHNKYANREVIDILFKEYSLNEKDNVKPSLFGNDEERLRWLKKYYNKTPILVRPLLNFFYRYFIKFGFLDGTQGLIWHLLQSFWYRTLVDAKVYELKKRFNNNEKEIIDFLKTEYKL
ncbi:glycosyltransferase family 2 protein [Flammeovirga sp. SJP92]|uniref:glycosyltransferase family 2 protein n=1 Tax=Flammeovirga sp. SJP92 TaxID=1775430 RepID=UPI00078939E8|nr:glycosyltransferase family 2 protein [Flammeovirga sp. SJP92]KXX72554.1 hypothetical protein AVL50_00345 [Flammeovirga sp. SJP92]